MFCYPKQNYLMPCYVFTCKAVILNSDYINQQSIWMLVNSLMEMAYEHLCWGPPSTVWRLTVSPLSVSSQMFDLEYLSWNLKTILVHPVPNLFSFRLNNYKNWWIGIHVHVQITVFLCLFYFHLSFSVTSNVEFDGPRIYVSRMVVKCEETLSLAWWSGDGGLDCSVCYSVYAVYHRCITVQSFTLPAWNFLLWAALFSLSWEPLAYFFPAPNVIVYLLLSVRAALCLCLRLLNERPGRGMANSPPSCISSVLQLSG